MHFFKIHHGFSSNPKFNLVSHRTKTPKAVVLGIITSLLEYASMQNPRGSVSGFNAEAYAFDLGIEEETVVTVCHALRNIGFITEGSIGSILDQMGSIRNWEEYQTYDRTAAERQRRFRENKRLASLVVTDVTRDVTDVTQRRVDKIREEDSSIVLFDEFWFLYPRKEAKQKARVAYKKALSGSSHEIILAGLRKYILAIKGKDAEFIAHPASWLNGKRWEDEQSSPPSIRNKMPSVAGG